MVETRDDERPKRVTSGQRLISWADLRSALNDERDSLEYKHNSNSTSNLGNILLSCAPGIDSLMPNISTVSTSTSIKVSTCANSSMNKPLSHIKETGRGLASLFRPVRPNTQGCGN